MPTFTPPTREEGASSDALWGRYSIPVGISVLRVNGVFAERPYPALVEIDGLTEGVDWFQGGRTYAISDETAAELSAAGFVPLAQGYGETPYGVGPFGVV